MGYWFYFKISFKSGEQVQFYNLNFIFKLELKLNLIFYSNKIFNLNLKKIKKSWTHVFINLKAFIFEDSNVNPILDSNLFD